MASKKNSRRAARRLFRLCLVGGALDKTRVRQVGAVVAASARRGSLATLAAFVRLVRLHTDRHTAVVESAEPVPPDLRENLKARLAHRYGDGIRTTFTLHPALLGGMRIRVGSEVYDDSVRGRLSVLEARLSPGAMHRRDTTHA